MSRPIYVIASEIRKDWKKVNYAAVPYLQAMATLGDIREKFYADSGSSVVMYFLANAGTWRGEVARRIKKELNEMLKS
jgi:hypothetical protein